MIAASVLLTKDEEPRSDCHSKTGQSMVSASSSCGPRCVLSSPWSQFLESFEFHIKQKDRVKRRMQEQNQSWDEAWKALQQEWKFHDNLNKQLPPFKATDPAEGTTKSIAFLFLTVGPLTREDIWIPWFASASAEKYEVIVHNDKGGSSGQLANIGKQVTPTKTDWASSGLVRATLLMLREALKNPSNTHFILFSNADIPLYSFDELYTKVTSSRLSRFNKMSFNFDESLHRKIWQNPDGHEWHGCSSHAKADQWSMWNRDDATFFAERNFLQYIKPCTLFVDEPYFIQMMYQHDRQFENACVTFTNWKFLADSPDTYADSVPDRRLQKARRKGAWFFRKVTKSATLPEAYWQRIGLGQ